MHKSLRRSNLHKDVDPHRDVDRPQDITMDITNSYTYSASHRNCPTPFTQQIQAIDGSFKIKFH